MLLAMFYSCFLLSSIVAVIVVLYPDSFGWIAAGAILHVGFWPIVLGIWA